MTSHLYADLDDERWRLVLALVKILRTGGMIPESDHARPRGER